MTTISQQLQGKQVVVKKISGSEEMKKRLLEQGIRPNQAITVVSAVSGHPAIVIVKNAKVMIDYKTSQEIIVSYTGEMGRSA